MTAEYSYNCGWLNVRGKRESSEIIMNPSLPCNLLGYIPLISAICGIWRIYENINHGHAIGKFTGDRCFGIMRGVCEILGIGILFLLLDLILTLVVYINHKR